MKTTIVPTKWLSSPTSGEIREVEETFRIIVQLSLLGHGYPWNRPRLVMTGIGESIGEEKGEGSNANNNVEMAARDIKQHGPVRNAVVNLGGVVNIGGDVHISTSEGPSKVSCSPG